MTVPVSDVVKVTVKKLTESYDLEAEFIESVKSHLESTLNKYHIYTSQQGDATDSEVPVKKVIGKAKKDPSVPKKTRAPCGYNFYVKEKMEEFKQIPYKERMKKISVMWNSETDLEKNKYNKIASDVNLATATNTSTDVSV